MLTEEQIKNLKPGDPLIIHGTFVMVDADGDICIKTSMTSCGYLDNHCHKHAHPSVVSIVKPKHDPCRPFKKGDKVRPVERYGRKPDDGAPVNVICEVEEDESEDGTVCITYCHDKIAELFRVTVLYLELVTPVEELEPYELVETTDYWSVEKENDELCLFWKKHHPHAKTAAEAERDRLNAEHRKEQK